MVRVSAIITTYNRPEHLSDAIGSVLTQTFDDIELVVIDDGSDDDYAEDTVESYGDDVRLVTHDQNRGLSAARNTGIDAATGEYVAFLDDDDRWEPSKVSRQVAALDANPDAGLATCLLTAITPDGDPLRCEGAKPSGDLSDDILVRNVIGSPSRVLVRSSALDTVGTFDETLPTKQDWDLYIRLCQDWEVICVERPLCRRVVHQSMSSSPAAARDDNLAVIEKHRQLIRERGLLDETMGAYLANIGRTYIENSEMNGAREYLSQSLDRHFRLWHAGMYLLTYLGPAVADRIIAGKRWVERRRNCRGTTMVTDPP
jgi:glycosyltransferase involved in cell wall biosynthesis